MGDTGCHSVTKKLPRMLFGLWTVSFCKGGSKRNATAHCEALGRVRLALGESAGEMWRPKMYSPSAFTHARQKPRRVLKSPLGMPQRRAVDIFRPSRVLATDAMPRFLCKEGFFYLPGGIHSDVGIKSINRVEHLFPHKAEKYPREESRSAEERSCLCMGVAGGQLVDNLWCRTPCCFGGLAGLFATCR